MTFTIVIPPALEVLVSAGSAVASFIFGKVVFRYMILPWVGHYLAVRISNSLKPSEREHIISRHFMYRRRGKIHQTAWPWRCNDGKCTLL